MHVGVVDAGATLDGPRGRYRLVAEHGHGATGVTWRAVRESDGRPVIVKTLRLDRLPGWKAFDLFERETRILRGLSHPGVPDWVDDFLLGGADRPRALALVMGFVEGRTLRQVGREGGLSPAEMRRWLGEVLAILEYLHGRAPPVVHRDVTPKNVILRPDGSAALVDFGSVQAALRAGDDHTAAGTFGYAAPEQFVGRVTPAADLYGLGMTYLAVASGREPDQLPIDGLQVRVAEVLPGDAGLAALIAAMTEPDPRRRLGSAAEARRRLEGARRAVPGSAGRTPAGAGGYLLRLRVRLEALGFTVEADGELARTRLAFRARRAAQGLSGPLELYATRADWLEGGGAGRAPSAFALALFAQAAGRAQAERGGWRTLLGARPVIVPLVVSAAGVEPRSLDRLAADLREPDGGWLVPAVVDLRSGAAEVVRPRSLLAGDRAGVVESVRRLVDFLGDASAELRR